MTTFFSINQVEIQEYFQQDKLRTHCNNRDILIQGYNSLGNLRENFNALKVQLDQDDVNKLKSLERNLRLNPMKSFTVAGGIPTDEFWDVEFDSAFC